MDLTSHQCCSPDINGGGGWGIFNSLFGWQNSATVGSVLAYNLYWLAVIVTFLAMAFNEKNGHWPLMKTQTASKPKGSIMHHKDSESSSDVIAHDSEKPVADTGAGEVREIRE
jgi:high-affinity iron transporter